MFFNTVMIRQPKTWISTKWRGQLKWKVIEHIFMVAKRSQPAEQEVGTMDKIASERMLVARHSQLSGSTEHTGYGTYQRVSFEVQPTNDQELAKWGQGGIKMS